ncbi:hypothetical protein [Rugamonas aquatica]|uniref:Uncharacterized protein n=1 Tax=Rugamonas aquatica TaxID=2743357 RepID=A0A6A7MVB1_9BURK|nr:hypothetical protein [Rugamonas aquatica]MQA37066.1 hypothetical protein [Rugamonas aquatica]
MQNDFEWFGTPLENIESAKKWADSYHGRHKFHVRVPTRKEVLSMPANELSPLLIGWMVHSPTEIIPSKVQIELVLELLYQRSDTNELAAVIAMCKQYSRNH